MNRRRLVLQATMFSLFALALQAEQPAPVTNSLGMNLMFVPAGTYMRGDDQQRIGVRKHFNDQSEYQRRDEQPLHPVRLTKPFYLGATEVTVGQFKAFVAATRYKTTAESGEGIVGWQPLPRDPQRDLRQSFERRAEFNWRQPGFPQTDSQPVVGVSWHDAKAFCQWLSKQESACYRLPTEAEWERACRAGTNSHFNWGDEYRGVIHTKSNVANVELERAWPDRVMRQWLIDVEQDPADPHVFTAPVGSYPPNRWGLHDMHGNVWEWCEDVYFDTFYKQWGSPRYDHPPQLAIDPLNLGAWNEHGDWRAIRGGAWCVSPVLCRSSVRSWFESASAAAYLGFRVVRDADETATATAKLELEREDAARKSALEAVERVQSFEQHYIKLRFSETPSLNLLAQLPRISNLRAVEIRSRQDLTPAAIVALARIPELRALQLQRMGPEINDDDLAPLAGKKKLTSIELSDAEQLTDQVLRHFTDLPQLRVLRLTGQITDAGLASLSKCRQLEELHVSSAASGVFLRTWEGLPLKRLSIAQIDDAGAQWLPLFPGIETFESWDGARLSNDGFEFFGRLPELKTLALQNVKGITDAGFSPLRAMRELTSLNLRGTQAGDAAARAIAKLPRLGDLALDSRNLTDAGMEQVGEIVSLRTLRLGPSTVEVTDRGIEHLWRLNRLGRLLIDSDAITAKGLRALSELPELREIRGREIVVSPQERDYLQELMPGTRFDLK